MKRNDSKDGPDTEAVDNVGRPTPPPEPRPTQSPTSDASMPLSPTQKADGVDVRRTIGRYAVLKELGRGGMGVVYLAHQDDLNREVALKVINAGPDADPTELARFQFEAETAANLHHPNIVPVYEVGRADGVAFMAMEYVRGGNLYRRINKQPMPVREAAAFLEPLARAMHYAHTHGVVHRDLKPSNILLEDPEPSSQTTPRDDTRLIPGVNLPVPKIADFGLAKRVDRNLGLTLSGVAIGTPHYMAPEQARGDSERIGPLTDVYALGTILYEMLIGYPPFNGANSMETMEYVVHRKAIPPSKLRHAIPAELDAICMTCLEKRPSDRYPSAEALADALKVFLTGEAISTVQEPLPALPDIKPPSRLMPMFIGAMAMTPVAVFATWFALQWMQPKPEPTPPPPEPPDLVTPLREQLNKRAEFERTLRFAQARAELEQGQLSTGLSNLRRLVHADGVDAAWADFKAQVDKVINAWQPYVLETSGTVTHSHVAHVAMFHQRPGYVTAGGNVVKFWDSKKATELREGIVVDGVVTAIALSSNDRYLAIGTSERKVTIWDLPLNQRVGKTIEWAEGGAPITLAFADDDLLLRVGVAGANLRSYVVQTSLPKNEPVYRTPDRVWQRWAIHANGLAVAAAEDGELSTWNTDEPKTTPILPPSLGALADLQIAPEARFIAALTTGGNVKQFNCDEGRWLDMPIAGHVSAFAYSPDGNIMAIGKQNGTVRLWDAVARAPLTEATTVPGAVVRVDLHADGTLAVATSLGKVHTFRFQALHYVAPPMWLENKPGKEVLGLAFSPDGTRLYVTSPLGVSRWNVVKGTRLKADREYPAERQLTPPATAAKDQIRLHAGVVVPAVKSDPEAILVGGSAGRVCLIDSTRSEAPHLAQSHLDNVEQITSVAVTREGHTTGAAGRLRGGKGVVVYWTQTFGAKEPHKRDLDFVVNHTYFSRNARELVLGCADGTIRRLDVIKHELVPDYYDCGSPVLCVAINDEGNRILAGCADGTAHLWDIYERRAVHIIRHAAEVRAVAFGKGLITAGADGTWRVWDEGTGFPLGPAHRHADAIVGLAVRGDMLATAGRDRSIRIWRLP